MFLLFIAFFVLIAVDLGVAVGVLASRDREQRVISRKLNPARDTIADLSTAFVDQESGQRGYIITGRNSFLTPYNDGAKRVDDDVTTLRRQLAGFPLLLDEVDQVSSGVAAWRSWAAEPEIEARRSGRADLAAELVSSGLGAGLFRQANNQIANMRTGLLRELARRQAHVDQSRRTLTEAVFVSFGLGVGLLIVSALAIERWVHEPIAELSEAVNQVAAGRLGREIPSPPVPDFAELSADVDSMRHRILRELDDADRAREALAKRGLLVLALRDELARGGDQLPPSLSAAARFEPAEGVVAGDWWDIVRLDDDRAALALVDVSGHGAASGVFALRSKQLFVAALRSGWEPGESLSWIAASLGDTGEQFLTGIVLEVRSSTMSCRYANAGHPPMLLCRPGQITELSPSGPLLGPLPGRWETREVDLPHHSFVAAYTDGLIEARDEQHQEFGVARLKAAIGQADGRRGPEGVADACLTALRRFSSRRPSDDVTLVVLGRD